AASTSFNDFDHQRNFRMTYLPVSPALTAWADFEIPLEQVTLPDAGDPQLRHKEHTGCDVAPARARSSQVHERGLCPAIGFARSHKRALGIGQSILGLLSRIGMGKFLDLLDRLGNHLR